MRFYHLLTWDIHMSMLSKRSFQTLTAFLPDYHHAPRSVIKVFVTVPAISQSRYCISVFGNGSKRNMNRPQRNHELAAKVICGRRKYDNVSDLVSDLGWM